MPLPAQRTVTGLYTNPITGNPATGTVTFAPYPETWTDTNGNQVMSGHQTVTLVNGAFSQALVPTDTPAVFPSAGKLWKITEQLTGQPKNVWFFELVTSGASIDITDLVELDPEPPPFVPEGTAGGDLVGSYPSPQLRNTQTARDHLGLGGAATLSVGTASGTVAAGDDPRIVGSAQKAANLSDLASASTARTNLGLTPPATAPFGTGAGQVAEGNDSRVVGAAQKAQNLADLTSASTARTNLGLGNSAIRDIGLLQNQVANGEAVGLTSGIVSGGEMNVNGSNPLAIDFSATVGYVIDYTTTPAAPSITRVTSGAQTVALSNLVSPITWWLMTSAGAIIQQTSRPTNSQRRTHLQLGATVQAGGAAIIVEQSLPVVLAQPVNQLYDLMYALGAFSINGNAISANGANLTFNKTAGDVFAPSFNKYAGPTLTNDPHVSPTAAQTPAQFRYVFRSTNPVPPPITTLDPANYDVGGVLTAIPGGTNTATVQRVFLFASNATPDQLVVQYGQTTYSSLDAAVAGIATESFVVNPTASANGVLIGYIAMTKSATALNNTAQARFVPAAKFGGAVASPAATASAVRMSRVRVTNGTITDVPSAASWTIVQTSGGTPLQCAIPAAVGDRIRICPNFMYSGTRYLDWAVLNSAGALAAYYLVTETSTPGTEGNPVMYPSNSFGKMNGTEMFTVTAPMLNGSNQVVVALANQGTGIGVVYAHPTYPWKLRLENVGPEPA